MSSILHWQLDARSVGYAAVALPPGSISVESLLRPPTVPCVSIAPSRRQLAHITINRLLAVTEDREPCSDAVVACPNRPRAGLGFKMPALCITSSPHPLLSHDCFTLQPSCACVDRRNHRRRWMLQLHQVHQHIGTLSRRQCRRFIVPSRDRRKGQRVVLLRPNGALPLHDHLRR